MSATMTVDDITPGTAAEATPQKGWLRRSFEAVCDTIIGTVKAGAGLCYDFAKANPIVTAVGADLLLTGGTYTQAMLVAATQTVAGALGEVTSHAAQGLWGMVFN